MYTVWNFLLKPSEARAQRALASLRFLPKFTPILDITRLFVENGQICRKSPIAPLIIIFDGGMFYGFLYSFFSRTQGYYWKLAPDLKNRFFGRFQMSHLVFSKVIFFDFPLRLKAKVAEIWCVGRSLKSRGGRLRRFLIRRILAELRPKNWFFFFWFFGHNSAKIHRNFFFQKRHPDWFLKTYLHTKFQLIWPSNEEINPKYTPVFFWPKNDLFRFSPLFEGQMIWNLVCR